MRGHMPRLTDTDYLRIRFLLRSNWFDKHASYFQSLKATEQWDVHDFYAPTRDYTDGQALEHRRKLTRESPSLPHRAGKALRQIERVVLRPRAEVLALQPDSAKRGIRVHAVVRPEVDTHKLLRFLEQMGDQASERNRAA